MASYIGYVQGIPIEQRKAQSKEPQDQSSDVSEGGAEIAADLMSSDEDEDKLDGAFDE